jgi:hypothetical protein
VTVDAGCKLSGAQDEVGEETGEGCP